MGRSTVTNLLIYLSTVFLLWMPKGLSRAEERGYVLADGKLTILTTEGFGKWKDVNLKTKLSVTKIEIAEGIRNIPTYSFRELVRLQSVELPVSLETIGGAAFFRCQRLSRVRFPANSNLKVIGAHAFRETGLESVSIPVSVKEIRNSAFRECGRLSSVIFPEKGVLEIIGEWGFSQTPLGSVSIPASVRNIKKAAFLECRHLSSLKFSQGIGLKRINAGVFSLTALDSVEIPESVRVIEERAFSYCRRLQSVTFSGFELEEIGSFAFAEAALRSVFIPASVQKIGSLAFLDCKRLRSLSFAEDANLGSMGKAAFYGTGVRFVQIPSSLAVIDAGVFSHSRVRFVYIPESVVAIEKSAFSYTRLESVLIPKSVKLIGDKAFSNCSRLKKVEFASFNAPEKFGKDVFDMCLSLTAIYIPKEGKGYRSSNWEKYERFIKE
ncbi:leucine-rich repeat domain-containing protein [uncultured Parabacteroides sp.]|uniref:leucine-rich repeat domain-containing protein n=1 Tax=uncultured Parabacteroides sp. TaxID=512312 RepID=UPI00262D9090|nr:leucine-rich repeat domain-containing protein [uncultured Parabacteroides sp.]